MSSLAIKKYLSKILSEYEKSSVGERESQQRRAHHAISTDLARLKADIGRAQAAFNIPRDVTDALYTDMSKNITDLASNNGNLTFNDILSARQSAGVVGTATSKAGNEYNTVFLKDPSTGQAYVDPNGVKIQLKDLLQADHEEGIATIQTKAQLKKLLRYRDKYIKDIKGSPTDNQNNDIKLLNLVINVLHQTLVIQEKIDSLGQLDKEIEGSLSGAGISQRAIRQFLSGNSDLNIDISSEPTITMDKIVNHKTKSISFVLSSDNNLAGTLSKSAKQAGASAIGLAIFNVLQSTEHRAFKEISLRRPTGNSYSSKYSVSSSVAKEVFKDPKVFAHLKGSPSYIDYIKAEVIEALTEGKVKKEKPKSSKTTVKGKKESLKIKIPKLPKVDTNSIRISPLRNLAGQFTSTVSLQALMQQMLHDTIKKNMQRPNLHYQTGRFAKSVKVEHISRGRDGALTAFLSYMRYPYATFEAGGKQGHKGYYPSRLINQSAREIAAKLTRERFTSVTIK